MSSVQERQPDAKGDESFYDARTLWELVDRRAAATPEATIFFDDQDRKLRFGDFRDWAERVAAGLQDRGVGEATVVAWQLPTRLETVVLSMALSRIGATQVPIIPLYRQREVGSLLRQTTADWLVVPSRWRNFDFASMARALSADSRHQVSVLIGDELPEGDPDRLPPPPGNGDIVRWIYSTSGTTSEPKGVLHTDRSLIAGGIGLSVARRPRGDDVGMIAYPYAHIGGPDQLVQILAHGTASLLMEAFVPNRATELMRKYNVTTAGGSTAFYLAFLDQQRKQPSVPVVPSLRLLNGGGAPMPPEIFRQVRRDLGVPVTHGYGMTECPMIANGSPWDTDEQLATTVGKPVRGCEVQVRDQHGSTVAVGHDGDFWVRGPMLFKGYTDPGLTEKSFDDLGFFNTGDRGHLDSDGHVVITGRTKDLIIRKGENISPGEVEDVLHEHPKVGAAAVIGLPDSERGERVCAVVETAYGEEPLTWTEMQEHCRARGLMTQKIPEQLEIVDVLPRNPTMKVLKTELRRRFS